MRFFFLFVDANVFLFFCFFVFFPLQIPITKKLWVVIAGFCFLCFVLLLNIVCSGGEKKKQVLLSYSGNFEGAESKKLKLGATLNRNGFCCKTKTTCLQDILYLGFWRWMKNTLEEIDYILIVCDKDYHDQTTVKRTHNRNHANMDLAIEYGLIEEASHQRKIPVCLVIFEKDDMQYRPFAFKQQPCFFMPEKIPDLITTLSGKESVVLPPSGNVTPPQPIQIEPWTI